MCMIDAESSNVEKWREQRRVILTNHRCCGCLHSQHYHHDLHDDGGPPIAHRTRTVELPPLSLVLLLHDPKQPEVGPSLVAVVGVCAVAAVGIVAVAVAAAAFVAACVVVVV